MARSRYERQSVSAGYDWLESVPSNEAIGRRLFWHNLESGCRSGFSCELLWGPRNTSATPCFCCPVGQKDSALHYNDFRVAPVPAPWMNQIRNVLYFLANPSDHPLLNWGPVTMLTLTLDWMHCKYLGSDKLLYGGVFHVIVYKLLPGTAQQNMVQTWNLLKAICIDSSLQIDSSRFH